MKHTGSANSTSKSSASLTSKAKQIHATVLVGLCLKSKVNIDLNPGRLYRILPDSKAKLARYIRVIDESGESYLYPAKYFRALRLPASVAKRLLH